MTAVSSKEVLQFIERANASEKILKQLEVSIQALTAGKKSARKVQQDIINDNQGWEVWYWPIISRGNFVSLLFVEAGVPYKNVADASLIAKNACAFGHTPTDGYFHSMAVPFIKRGDFLLSQTLAIVQYLGKKFDLIPESIHDQALAQMLIANVNDDLQVDC